MMMNKKSPIEWLSLNDRLLAINPQTGGWLLLDDRCKEIVSLIESGFSTEEISRQYIEVPFCEIERLKKMLVEHNLIVREHGLTKKCNSDCKEKEYPALAVFKVTLACNLKCVYCYANAGVDQSSHMSVETAHKIVDEFARLNPYRTVNMLMHGGEPLLNFKLVKDIAEYAKKYGKRVQVTIQTNAALLNDEIATYIKKNNINVGVSLVM